MEPLFVTKEKVALLLPMNQCIDVIHCLSLSKMAKQAEAERERRSKIIAAEGEFQASQRLADAAQILAGQPSALTLRYLQTLREIATEKNSTTIFPVPIDLLKPFLKGTSSES